MDIPLRQVKSRPHASQVLIAQPHLTAVLKFKVLLIRVTKATRAVGLAAPARARMVVDAALVGGQPLFDVRRPGSHALFGGAGPQHPNPDVPMVADRLTHDSLAKFPLTDLTGSHKSGARCGSLYRGSLWP